MSKRAVQALLATLWGTASSPALAQGVSSGAQSDVRAAVGLVSGTYSQGSANSQMDASDQSAPVKTAGAAADLGFVLYDVDTDLRYLSASAKDNDWYRSRQELSLMIGPRLAAAPWVIPSAGFYQLSQASDRTVADAPIAFIDHTTTLALGVRFAGMPFEVDGHGLLLRGRLAYLTSGEAKTNFGDLQEFAVGYGYKAGSLETGLTAGVTRTFLSAGTERSGVSRTVRETNQSTLVSVYVEY